MVSRIELEDYVMTSDPITNCACIESIPEPITERAIALRTSLSVEQWECRVRKAIDTVRILHKVRLKHRETRLGIHRCLSEVAPQVHRSTYLNWRRLHEGRPGPDWERLLDRRDPPRPTPIPEQIRSIATLLRRVQPEMSCDIARSHLVNQFGGSASLCDSSLYKLWRRAGLTNLGDPSRFERVERYAGGAALALLGAAATDTGIPVAMAKAALEAGAATAKAQAEVNEIQVEGRDAEGRFKKEYNQNVRQGVSPGKADSRWTSDERKRGLRNLKTLQVLKLTPETLSRRFLAIGMVSLITERRGFDGMEGLRANWIAAAGQVAYRPATLDKTLAQFGLLNVGGALWSEHGKQWAKKVKHWTQGGPRWLQIVRYVDISTDPYWTKRFALSGKVSRVNQLMPCLSRVAVTGGPGIPLLMETYSGAKSLKTVLLPALAATEELCESGPRLTVMDSEGFSIEILTAMMDIPDRHFVTVLKGMGAKNVKFEESSEWEPYRKRDRIRSGYVVVNGKGAPEGGLRLRAVEMERMGSSNPQTTTFVTNAKLDLLSALDVANVYLSRWPNQEGVFREGRNGAGLNHSHGYGGDYVTHVTLETKLKATEDSLVRAQQRVESARLKAEEVRALTITATAAQLPAAKQALQQMEREVRAQEKKVTVVDQKRARLATMPNKIFRRDTARENIATSLNLMVMLLIEWVLREYFGGLKMEMRTFLEFFLYPPTEVRTRATRVLHRLDSSGLPLARAEQLRGACAAVTKRKLQRDGRLLVFETVDPRLDQIPKQSTS